MIACFSYGRNRKRDEFQTSFKKFQLLPKDVLLPLISGDILLLRTIYHPSTTLVHGNLTVTVPARRDRRRGEGMLSLPFDPIQEYMRSCYR
jgi:hypothetical protein